MTYTSFDIVHGVVSFVALAWMLYLVVRSPRDGRRWAVTGLLAGWALAYPFGIAASEGVVFLGADPMTSRYLQHAFLLVAAFSLVCFFVFAAVETPRARGRILAEAIPLCLALVIMTVANAVMPADLRVAAATVTATPGEGPVSEDTMAAFYVAANSYLLYAFAAACLWTRRYASRAEPRLRRGLRIASIGLLAISLAGAMFVTSNITRWLGTPAPRPIVFVSIILLLAGIVLFVVGISYPTVVTRLAALRVWLRHRAAYRRLRPLWMVLHAQFPQDALNRVPAGRLRDLLSLRGVHRRYYRRVIECRDGLVRISPYVASLRTRDADAEPERGSDADTPQHLAEQLREALRAYAEGRAVASQAIPVAMPHSDGLDADVDQLIALSEAMRQGAQRAAV